MIVIDDCNLLFGFRSPFRGKLDLGKGAVYKPINLPRDRNVDFLLGFRVKCGSGNHDRVDETIPFRPVDPHHAVSRKRATAFVPFRIVQVSVQDPVNKGNVQPFGVKIIPTIRKGNEGVHVSLGLVPDEGVARIGRIPVESDNVDTPGFEFPDKGIEGFLPVRVVRSIES